MRDHPDFLQTPEDVARLYGDRIYLVDDLLGAVEPPPREAPRTLLTVVRDPESAAPVAPPETPAPPEPEKPKEKKASYLKPGITWKPKDNSKVLFILHQAELKNKTLTELLKQIVLSIEIPFESAGFGIIKGPVVETEFEEMPNPYGIVFDETLLPGEKNPMPTVDGSVFFTQRLKDLQHDKTAKRALWNYLKSIKSLL
ncbi:MAG: hypothetical protein AAGN35_26770 [Bacteroidota bacterium]